MDKFIEGKSLSRERLLVIIILSLALISVLIALLSAISEIYSKPPLLNKRAKEARSIKKTKLKALTPSYQRSISKPVIHPVKLLPREVVGASTRALQKVPGFEDYMAEAIYEPLSEELTRVTPVNTYVRVVYHSSSLVASEEVKKIINERYQSKQGRILIDGQIAFTGYDAQRGAYLIAWTIERYSFEVESAFIAFTPTGQEKTVINLANSVAREVLSYARGVLQGKGK
jgi:hypothetical protein